MEACIISCWSQHQVRISIILASTLMRWRAIWAADGPRCWTRTYPDWSARCRQRTGGRDTSASRPGRNSPSYLWARGSRGHGRYLWRCSPRWGPGTGSEERKKSSGAWARKWRKGTKSKGSVRAEDREGEEIKMREDGWKRKSPEKTRKRLKRTREGGQQVEWAQGRGNTDLKGMIENRGKS